MKIYISGGMSGLPDLNFPAFDKARDICLACGYEVVSPADLERNRSPRSYKENLRDDFRHLLECDQILMLKGWQHSNGARVEFVIAKAIGLLIIKEN
jgi:hypothetical protein